jgi:hypothetical protein
MAVNWGIKQFKASFFDAKKLKASVNMGLYGAMSKFGAFVQRRMKSSIRNRKKSSKPGQPPTNQTGMLREFIFFGLDTGTGSVVVGPAKTNQRNAFGTRGQTIPNVLEKGGLVGVLEHQLPVRASLGPYSGQWVRTDLRYRLTDSNLRSAVGRPTRVRWAFHDARPFVDRAGKAELATGKHMELLRKMVA